MPLLVNTNGGSSIPLSASELKTLTMQARYSRIRKEFKGASALPLILNNNSSDIYSTIMLEYVNCNFAGTASGFEFVNGSSNRYYFAEGGYLFGYILIDRMTTGTFSNVVQIKIPDLDLPRDSCLSGTTYRVSDGTGFFTAYSIDYRNGYKEYFTHLTAYIERNSNIVKCCNAGSTNNSLFWKDLLKVQPNTDNSLRVVSTVYFSIQLYAQP